MSLKGVIDLYESFSEEEYKSSGCLSYSIIKDVYDNPDILITGPKEKEGEWLTFGTLVDMILTLSQEDLDKSVVVNNSVPSEQFKNISDYIVSNNLDINSLTDSQVEEVYVQSGSLVNWLPDTKRKKMIENCGTYIKLLTENKDKLIVTTDMLQEAIRVADVFSTHRWTKHLFADKTEQEKLGVEILYQLKIKYIYDDLLFKSKIDIVYVDHKKKTITPYDIKTGSDLPRSFASYSIYKYKYCYQAVLYREGLEAFIEEIEPFKGYKVENFKFVYVSRLKPTYPVIVEVPDRIHHHIRDVGMTNGTYEILALADILEAVHSYMEDITNGKTDIEPYDIATNEGQLMLGTFFTMPPAC